MPKDIQNESLAPNWDAPMDLPGYSVKDHRAQPEQIKQLANQMGVELGKRLANNLLTKINSSAAVEDEDSSTNALINFYKK